MLIFVLLLAEDEFKLTALEDEFDEPFTLYVISCPPLVRTTSVRAPVGDCTVIDFAVAKSESANELESGAKPITTGWLAMTEMVIWFMPVAIESVDVSVNSPSFLAFGSCFAGVVFFTEALELDDVELLSEELVDGVSELLFVWLSAVEIVDGSESVDAVDIGVGFALCFKAYAPQIPVPTARTLKAPIRIFADIGIGGFM